MRAAPSPRPGTAIGTPPMVVIPADRLARLTEALRLAHWALKSAPLRHLGSTDNWRVATAIAAALDDIKENRP